MVMAKANLTNTGVPFFIAGFENSLLEYMKRTDLLEYSSLHTILRAFRQRTFKLDKLTSKLFFEVSSQPSSEPRASSFLSEVSTEKTLIHKTKLANYARY